MAYLRASCFCRCNPLMSYVISRVPVRGFYSVLLVVYYIGYGVELLW